jgi:antimicrobial peptide system SdpB family protein
MLTRIARAATAIARTHNPWTNVYGVARSLIALATATTLLFDSSATLFRPLAGIPTEVPFCVDAAQRASLFCLVPRDHLDVARWLSIIGLLIVASGWRPRFTGILHWWIALGFQSTATIVDGGDQVATVLTLLLLPVTLTDGRRWHWQRAAQAEPPTSAPAIFGRVAALSAMVAIRVQVAAIYFHAGVGKMKVTEWADGTAMYYWMQNPTFGVHPSIAPLMHTLLGNAGFVAALTWGTITLEVLLSAGLLATRRARGVLLIFGIGLHIGIIVFMGLFSFGVTMIGALILFLRPLDAEFAVPAWIRLRMPRVRHERASGAASASLAA